MAEAIEKVESEDSKSPIDTQKPDSPDKSTINGPRARKRTKTGCLTCRKRRIKCGEERPICANCVKSKRNCEGYAPRLTFKDPMSAYPHGWPVQDYHLPPGVESQYLQQSGTGALHPQFPLIAPRPLPDQEQYLKAQISSQTSQASSIYSGLALTTSMNQSMNLQQQDYSPSSANSQSPSHTASLYGRLDAQRVPIGIAHTLPMAQSLIIPSPTPGIHPAQGSSSTITPTSSTSTKFTYEPRMLESSSSPSSYIPIASHSNETYQNLYVNGIHTPRSDIGQTSNHSYQIYGQDHDRLMYEYSQQHPAVAQLYEEDEYYDVESDEEMPDMDTANTTSIQKRQRDLSYVLSISGQNRNWRSVEAFLNQPNALATYAPRYSTSPLMDEATARIFCHFVTATGPLMSAYGRHPVNPALLFSGIPVPKSEQALWTYTIPMMAISNQALLHAILAVASLNIARLQQAPLTVPIKHYQYALRRVAKAVATPGKRTAMATVAATILLSQFEILSAEHSKWHSHLAGARQLLTEIDFAQWTDRIHCERSRNAAVERGCQVNGTTRYKFPSCLDTLPWIPEPGSTDEDILNRIIGTSGRHDFHGQKQETRPSRSNRPVTEKEMDDFQTYRDLFWTYTKIDNIQSFVSGRRLLLPLDRWVRCPPRAPMNRFDAVYGTLDHVALLLGRVADFAGKDVVRKRAAVRASGGVWRPCQGTFGPPGAIPSPNPQGMSGSFTKVPQMPSPPITGSMPSTPDQGPFPQSSAQTQMNHMVPTFNGLLPDSEQIATMPTAFTQAPRHVLYQPAVIDPDVELNEATSAAKAEWNNIQEAFNVFEENLGPAFAPLNTDAGPAIDTPFGPALQYRTFQVATCWLLFYMAKIIAIRTHPAMPPASNVAAGIAASRTAQYSSIIGRVTFGIHTPATNQPLNPIFGGAISEMMLPMFVAGVQYIDNTQRVVTIERLQFIADRIGHDSAALIAAGLERTWMKMYDAGRGPKYIPSVRVHDEFGRDLTEHQRQQPDNNNGKTHAPQDPNRDFVGRGTLRSKNRGAVILQSDTRAFAAGVMGLEESLKDLSMD